MIYRTLGRSGPRVSILGFGASPLGGVFGPVDKEECVRAVKLALDLGVNYFDVSPYYGAGKAETILGEALRGLDRGSYVLSTKVGRYGENEFDFSAARVRRSLEESAGRLGTTRFDVVFCHDVEFGDRGQIVEETLPELRLGKPGGTIAQVGISGYPLAALDDIRSRTDVDVVLSYAHLTLLDDSLLPFAGRIRTAGGGVVNASPLSMGLLTRAGPPDWHPASEEMRKACAGAAAMCDRLGLDIATLAIQHSVSIPDVDTTLVGMSSTAEVEKNIAALDATPCPKELAEVLRTFERFHGQEWRSGNRV